jgi:hypothetical protein
MIIWTQIYTAQFLNYDDNWGQLLGIILFSSIVTIVLLFFYFRGVTILKTNRRATILFLTVNNPVTITFVIYNYAAIFGIQLKV